MTINATDTTKAAVMWLIFAIVFALGGAIGLCASVFWVLAGAYLFGAVIALFGVIAIWSAVWFFKAFRGIIRSARSRSI